MKFKEQRGNVFIFDGGCAGGELELIRYDEAFGIFFTFKHKILVSPNLKVGTVQELDVAPYTDIQTAVNLMQILIDERLA